MAASGTIGDDAAAPLSRGARPLVIAYFAVFAALVLFGIAAVLFGDPRAGDPVIRMHLAQTPARLAAGLAHPVAPRAPPPAATASGETAVPPSIVPQTVTQSIYA